MTRPHPLALLAQQQALLRNHTQLLPPQWQERFRASVADSLMACTTSTTMTCALFAPARAQTDGRQGSMIRKSIADGIC